MVLNVEENIGKSVRVVKENSVWVGDVGVITNYLQEYVELLLPTCFGKLLVWVKNTDICLI